MEKLKHMTFLALLFLFTSALGVGYLSFVVIREIIRIANGVLNG